MPSPELIDKNFSRGPDKAPHFHALKRLSERLSYSLVSLVLESKTLTAAAAVLALLIRAGETCLRLNNYDTTVLIVSVLHHEAVFRLKGAWARAEKALPAGAFSNLTAAVGVAGRDLKASMMLDLMTDPPCMPAVGVFLTSLINAAEDPDLDPSDENAKRINLVKLRRVSTTVALVKATQDVHYSCHIDEEVCQGLLEDPDFPSEDSAYARSLELQGRAGK